MGTEDEEFAPTGRPRRHAALSRRHRFQRQIAPKFTLNTSNVDYNDGLAAAEKVQRPRTDWQRRGEVWVKVVPPWWCEQSTVHFASTFPHRFPTYRHSIPFYSILFHALTRL